MPAAAAAAAQHRPTRRSISCCGTGKDTRLQSQQEVQEARDRTFNYLADTACGRRSSSGSPTTTLRTVTVAPKRASWRLGIDDREYELHRQPRRPPLPGRLRDRPGDRRAQARGCKRVRWFNGPSPDGESFLYYEDGNYHVYSMATGQSATSRRRLPISFVDTEDDHNVVKPPTSAVGWASDSTAGAAAATTGTSGRSRSTAAPPVNLTVNGRKDAIRYQRRFALEPPRRPRRRASICRSRSIFAAYGEWTKKAGIARLDPGKPGVEDARRWADASFPRLMKAKNADVFVYTRRRRSSPATTTSTDATLGQPGRLTDQRPQVAQFTWSPGVQLVNYTSDKGDKLQAALFLPANYEKGKTYPTVVNIYEKMSQTANQFANPTANGFNRSVYTSNGYAVLVPDITYRVNDPGHVGGVVHGPGGEGGDRDRHRRSEASRHHRPLVGRLPDGVPRHADRHLRGGDRRRAADRHGQHVFSSSTRTPAAPTARSSRAARAGSRAASGTTGTPTTATRRSSSRRTSRRR